jgi:hypothetical protein
MVQVKQEYQRLYKQTLEQAISVREIKYAWK